MVTDSRYITDKTSPWSLFVACPSEDLVHQSSPSFEDLYKPWPFRAWTFVGDKIDKILQPHACEGISNSYFVKKLILEFTSAKSLIGLIKSVSLPTQEDMTLNPTVFGRDLADEPSTLDESLWDLFANTIISKSTMCLPRFLPRS